MEASISRRKKMASLTLQVVLTLSTMQILSTASGENTSIPCSTVQTTDGGCCVFPFVYNSKPVNGCTTEDSPLNYWCAKTDNYDRDKDWGYCLGIGEETEESSGTMRTLSEPNNPHFSGGSRVS
ncbi:hypothetical protein ACROYT_G001593 [Oculina patagonica]